MTSHHLIFESPKESSATLITSFLAGYFKTGIETDESMFYFQVINGVKMIKETRRIHSNRIKSIRSIEKDRQGPRSGINNSFIQGMMHLLICQIYNRLLQAYSIDYRAQKLYIYRTLRPHCKEQYKACKEELVY